MFFKRPKTKLEQQPVLWGIFYGRHFKLGSGHSVTEALEDARNKLSRSDNPTARGLLSELEREIPMIFWQCEPPQDCLGLVLLTDAIPSIHSARSNLNGFVVEKEVLEEGE